MSVRIIVYDLRRPSPRGRLTHGVTIRIVRLDGKTASPTSLHRAYDAGIVTTPDKDEEPSGGIVWWYLDEDDDDYAGTAVDRRRRVWRP
jgi:hypothetical protein